MAKKVFSTKYTGYNERDRVCLGIRYNFWEVALLESEFQGNLIKKLKQLFPGCMVLKNDPNYIQGIPDLTVLYRDKWAALEVKQTAKSELRPNQDYYVQALHNMSFAAFVYPENVNAVLKRLDGHFNGLTPIEK